MNCLPEIDKNKTRQNARSKLQEYRRLARIAGHAFGRYKSPLLDGIPTAKNYVNVAERSLLNKMSLQQECAAEVADIDKAILALPEDERQIVVLAYCVQEQLSGFEIADLVNLATNRNVEFIKQKAMLAFAEAYKGGELLAYKEGGAIDASR